MKYVFMMWGLAVLTVLLTALLAWNPALIFISGFIVGAATIMSLVEIQEAP